MVNSILVSRGVGVDCFWVGGGCLKVFLGGCMFVWGI